MENRFLQGNLKSEAAAVNWLSVHREQFSLANARSDEQLLRLIKPIGELALAASILRKRGRHSSWANQTLHYCWGELEQGNVLLRVLAARPDLVVASTLYACFYEVGLSNSRLDILLRHLEGCASCRSIEFPTWRRLDVAHGFAALGYRPFPSNPEVGTWLYGLPEPWMISEDIAYAVTHEIFYITDFGWQPERLTCQISDYVTAWLPAWSEIWARQNNWDLFAEFAMVAACLGKPSGAMLDRLATVQDSGGYFPGPGGSAASLIGSQTSAPRACFLANYHTTLVALMAFAMAG